VIDTGEASPILEIVDKDQNVIRYSKDKFMNYCKAGGNLLKLININL
jgi:hypothetical protein